MARRGRRSSEFENDEVSKFKENNEIKTKNTNNIVSNNSNTKDNDSIKYSWEKFGQPLFKHLLEAKTKDGVQLAYMFQKLPGRKTFADYYKIIKNPISLFEIREKFKNNEYTSSEQIISDFKLIATNAKTYNEDGSDICINANELLKLANSELTSLDDSYKESLNAPPLKKIKLTASIPSLSLTNNSSHNSSNSNEKIEKIILRKKSSSPSVSNSNTNSPNSLNPTEPKDSTLKPTITIKHVQNIMTNIIDELLDLKEENTNRKYSDMFIKIPSRRDYPAYYKVIPNPTSFTAVKKSMKSFNSWNDFKSATLLIFSNAKAFNEEKSLISNDAYFLEKKFLDLVSQQPEEIQNFDVNSLDNDSENKNKNKTIKLRLNLDETNSSSPVLSPKIKLNIRSDSVEKLKKTDHEVQGKTAYEKEHKEIINPIRLRRPSSPVEKKILITTNSSSTNLKKDSHENAVGKIIKEHIVKKEDAQKEKVKLKLVGSKDISKNNQSKNITNDAESSAGKEETNNELEDIEMVDAKEYDAKNESLTSGTSNENNSNSTKVNNFPSSDLTPSGSNTDKDGSENNNNTTNDNAITAATENNVSSRIDTKPVAIDPIKAAELLLQKKALKDKSRPEGEGFEDALIREISVCSLYVVYPMRESLWNETGTFKLSIKASDNKVFQSYVLSLPSNQSSIAISPVLSPFLYSKPYNLIITCNNHRLSPMMFPSNIIRKQNDDSIRSTYEVKLSTGINVIECIITLSSSTSTSRAMSLRQLNSQSVLGNVSSYLNLDDTVQKERFVFWVMLSG